MFGGHENAVPHVVAGLGPIDPPALLDGLLRAHPDVLRELLPEELRERSQHVVGHAPRCAREIELLGERVLRHALHDEGVGERSGPRGSTAPTLPRAYARVSAARGLQASCDIRLNSRAREYLGSNRREQLEQRENAFPV